MLKRASISGGENYPPELVIKFLLLRRDVCLKYPDEAYSILKAQINQSNELSPDFLGEALDFYSELGQIIGNKVSGERKNGSSTTKLEANCCLIAPNQEIKSTHGS